MVLPCNTIAGGFFKPCGTRGREMGRARLKSGEAGRDRWRTGGKVGCAGTTRSRARLARSRRVVPAAPVGLADLLHRLVQRRPFLVEALVLDLAQLVFGDVKLLGHDLVGAPD